MKNDNRLKRPKPPEIETRMEGLDLITGWLAFSAVIIFLVSQFVIAFMRIYYGG